MNKPEMFTNSQVRILETIARGLGAKDERERIIKLLSAIAEDCDNGICNCLSAQSTIELIKEETK